jgi:hypothetical protein
MGSSRARGSCDGRAFREDAIAVFGRLEGVWRRILAAALPRCTCEISKRPPEDYGTFILHHIRMIERRNESAGPFIVLSELGWGVLEDWI